MSIKQEELKMADIDFTKYPEGFEALCDMCDFIPEENKAAREAFVDGLCASLLTI